MKNILIASLALLLVPAVHAQDDAGGDCDLDGCDLVDDWCYDLDGYRCLRVVYETADCRGLLTSTCTWLDSWCYDLDGNTCTDMVLRLVETSAATSASPVACMGPVCDAINDVCNELNGRDCVAAST